MDCSTPGPPVHHQLPEFTQTHVRWVGDAIQPISSSVVPFSSHLQSFNLQSFHMSQFFKSGGQSIGVSASALVLPVNIQDWLPLRWTDWISFFFFLINSTLLYSVGNRELSPANSSSKCLWEGQLSVRDGASVLVQGTSISYQIIKMSLWKLAGEYSKSHSKFKVLSLLLSHDRSSTWLS